MNKRLYPILYTFLLTLVFVAATSAVAALMRPGIALNDRLLTRRVVIRAAGLLPEAADDRAVDQLYDERIAPLTDRDTRGIEILTVDGGRGGYVFRTAGQGYWGRIEGYVGVSSDLTQLTGVVFYKHVETPGLGGEIARDWFGAQFAGKRLDPSADPMIDLVEPGADLGPAQVHAVTGATRTSDAVETFLNRDLRTFLEVMSPK